MPEDQLLAELIAQAVEKAVQPLQDRISALEVILAYRERDMADLRQTVASLSSAQEQDASRLALDIAYDRQRLKRLEKADPGQTEEERIRKLMSYLEIKKDAGQRPEASFTEARAYLEISRSQFSQLVSRLDPRDFVVSPHPLNYKAKMIGLAHKM